MKDAGWGKLIRTLTHIAVNNGIDY